MSIRPAIELLESRQLLSGGPSDQHSLEQVESAVVDGTSVALHSSALAATARTSQNSPLPLSILIEIATGPVGTPPVPTIPPMMVAFRSLGGGGGPVTGPPNVHTSDRSVEPDAAGDGNSTSLDLGDGAKTTHLPAPQPVDEANIHPAASGPSLPVSEPGSVLDSCFADEAWALSLEDGLNSGSNEVAGLSELDLLVAAAGMAATVRFAINDSQTRPAPATQPRRQFCRPDLG